MPADFNSSDPSTDLTVAERAKQLSDQLQRSPQTHEASAVTAEKLEAEFDQRVQYFNELESNFSEAQRLIAKLRKERDTFSASTRVETG